MPLLNGPAQAREREYALNNSASIEILGQQKAIPCATFMRAGTSGNVCAAQTSSKLSIWAE